MLTKLLSIKVKEDEKERKKATQGWGEWRNIADLSPQDCNNKFASSQSWYNYPLLDNDQRNCSMQIKGMQGKEIASSLPFWFSCTVICNMTN